MKKPIPIQINIPKPCSENWEQMTPLEQGRFCAHCLKHVIDFTTWSDTALYQFFNKNDSPVCGRFSTYQINRPIHIPYQPHSRLYRIAIGLGLVLIFTQTPEANARIKPPFIVEQLSDEPSDKNDCEGCGTVSGVITDNNKKPMAGATIELTEGGINVCKAVTDSIGNYFIKIAPGRYDLKMSYVGYTSKLIQGVTVTPNHATEVSAELEIKINPFDSIIVVAYKAPLITISDVNRNSIILTGEVVIDTKELFKDYIRQDSIRQEFIRREPVNESKLTPPIPSIKKVK